MNNMVWLGYIISFVSGGLAGAFVNRFFMLRDRAIKKLILHIKEEEVKSIVPILISGKEYKNLIYKKFRLINSSGVDFPTIDIVFEFDTESSIIKKEVHSKKHGKNKFESTLRKDSELVFHLKNFNRDQEIDFIFEVANISRNFFCAVVDNCGVEIIIKNSKNVRQSSLKTTEIVDKIDLD